MEIHLTDEQAEQFGGRSKRQKLLDEAYAAAMKRLREQHEQEFQRYLIQEKESRNVGPGNQTESETDVMVILTD